MTKKKSSLRKGSTITVQKKPATMGKIIRSLGTLGGSTLGGMIGQPTAGGIIGRSLAASLSKWMGFGSYSIKRNSFLNLKGSNSIPMMHNTGQSVVIRHREFIADVIGGTGTPSVFNVAATYPLNPGLAGSFPWLAAIAQNFQEYTWRGVVYQFVSTSGDSTSSTNTALGSVMMATHYRSTAPTYTSKQFLLNEYCSSDSRPCDGFVHPIECDPRENPYNVQYVRSAAVPAGEDAKSYDLGVVSIATQGLPTANINIGELWVSYEVELRKPIANSLYQTDAAYSQLRRDTPGAGAPFGTVAVNPPNGNAINNVSNTLITFNAGNIGIYLLVISYTAGSTVSSTGMTLTPVNCTVIGQNNLNAGFTVPTGVITYQYMISITDAAAVPTLFCNTMPVSGTSASVYINAYELNSSITGFLP